MKVTFKEQGNTLITCDMDAIPRVGDRMIIKSLMVKVDEVLWWVDSPDDTYVQVIVV